MLFMARMKVNWPRDIDPQEAQALTTAERQYSARLQRSGKWKHLWRTTGYFGNISIFEVDSHEEMHEILANLPFFPFIDLELVPLSAHPGRVVDEH